MRRNMLVMTTPVTASERCEFKLLAGMAKEAGFELKVAERKATGSRPLNACVDYSQINRRHKKDVDTAFKDGKVYVVNGAKSMTKRGAIELRTQHSSAIEELSRVIGKELSREERIIDALLQNSKHKLEELGASVMEIRSAAAKLAGF